MPTTESSLLSPVRTRPATRSLFITSSKRGLVGSSPDSITCTNRAKEKHKQHRNVLVLFVLCWHYPPSNPSRRVGAKHDGKWSGRQEHRDDLAWALANSHGSFFSAQRKTQLDCDAGIGGPCNHRGFADPDTAVALSTDCAASVRIGATCGRASPCFAYLPMPKPKKIVARMNADEKK